MDEFDFDKEYTDADFDAMLISVYDENGYPFMDQFEYIDALYNNEGVERLRRDYFRRKALKENKIKVLSRFRSGLDTFSRCRYEN
jgi:hypothetical protein